MTALETAVYQQVPTDEAEAQMLASADLDDMKSKGDTTETHVLWGIVSDLSSGVSVLCL